MLSERSIGALWLILESMTPVQRLWLLVPLLVIGIMFVFFAGGHWLGYFLSVILWPFVLIFGLVSLSLFLILRLRPK